MTVAGVRKVRSDAWGEDFTEELRWALYSYTKPPTEEEKASGRPWLRSYEDAAAWLEAGGHPVPKRTSWYRFLERMREEAAERRVLSVETAKRIARGIQKVQVDSKLAADMFTGMSVDAMTQGNEDAAKILADAAAKYAGTALAERKLELDRAAQATKEEQLRLAREKFEAAERREAAAKGALADSALSDEDKVARMKEIFG